MIIPVKCVTCGKVLANKYRYYLESVRQKKTERGLDITEVIYFSDKTKDKSPEAEVLDALELHDVCCRRHMLTHVDIE